MLCRINPFLIISGGFSSFCGTSGTTSSAVTKNSYSDSRTVAENERSMNMYGNMDRIDFEEDEMPCRARIEYMSKMSLINKKYDDVSEERLDTLRCRESIKQVADMLLRTSIQTVSFIGITQIEKEKRSGRML